MANTAFFKMAEDWGLNINDQCKLLGVGLIDLEKVRKTPAQDQNRNKLIRIRCLVMVYKYLRKNEGTLDGVSKKLREPVSDSPFFGSSPLRHMLKNGVVGIAAATKFFTGSLPELQNKPEEFDTV